MEAIITIGLGIWVILSGVICLTYMSNDENREKEQ